MSSLASEIDPSSLPQANTGNGEVRTLLLTVLFPILGGIAILVITIAGFRYITSAGDPQKAASAKSTIIYAIIGLMVAVAAEAIVAFVVTSL